MEYPHNIEAEQAILGACLLDDDAIDRVSDIVRPESFYLAAHQEVYRVALALKRAGKPIDPVLLSERVNREAVPAGMCFALAKGVGAVANVRHYADTVRDLEIRRSVMLVAQTILRADADEGGAELVARVANELAALEIVKGRPARPLTAILLERLEELDREMKTGRADVLPTGFEALDNILGGLHVGETLTIAARPGVGKSALVSAMSDRIAARGIPVCIFQLEDYAKAIADRAISRRARISSVLLRDGSRLKTEHWDRIGSKVMTTGEWPVFVDDAHGRTISDLESAMRRMVKQHGIRVFILDNLSEVVLEGGKNRDSRLDREIGMVVRRYRDAAAAVNACPVLVVHLNREVEKGAERPPHLSDLKNSGDIEDASHMVAMPWRSSERPDCIRVEVVKNRNGPSGHVWLRWVEQFMSVEDV